MRFGREIAFFSYNTPTVPAARVSQSLGHCFHKHPPPLPGQCAAARHTTNTGFITRKLPSRLASSQMKGSHVQARIPRGRRKHVVCLGLVGLYNEMRFIAWEFGDKWSSQQMQEAAAPMDGTQGRTGAPEGTQGTKQQSWDNWRLGTSSVLFALPR